MHTTPKATMITLRSNPNKASELSDFLRAGRDLVVETEPGTPYWFALSHEQKADCFAIFDLFPDQAGRDAHFNGKVAAALNENAPQMVSGGWEQGVLANVSHYASFAQKVPSDTTAVTKGTVIKLRAVAGQETALADFLKVGRDMVDAQEPGTSYWFALQSEEDERNFAIVDFFTSAEGRKAHFAGEVAKALQQNAEKLVAGGWDDGVLKNVTHFNVVAAR